MKVIERWQAAEEEIIITRHGRPAGVLIGLASDDDWFEYRLEHHPEFLLRIQEARAAFREDGALHSRTRSNKRCRRQWPVQS